MHRFRNACEAIAAGDTVTSGLVSGTHPAHSYIHLYHGSAPIPPEVLPKLAEPFCSTKASGTRLGLAIVKRITMTHGEECSTQADALVGTIVSVQLPVATPKTLA